MASRYPSQAVAAPAAATAGGAPEGAAGQIKGGFLGYKMVVLAAVPLAALIIVPLIYSAVLSAYDWRLVDLNKPKDFTGFDNYTRLWSDDVLRTALANTLVFVVASVGIELVLGFAVAFAVFNLQRGGKVANGIILLPMIITPIITALIWRYILDPQFGLVAQLLDLAGRDGIDVFGQPSTALAGLILIDVWQWTPFVILVLHAGMVSMPGELFEAAAVDGASARAVIRHLMLPALVPQILVVLLFRTMDSYRIFDTMFVLTRGGPGRSTETLGLYTYRTGFSFLEMGYAMALSIFILITVGMISAFYVRVLRRSGTL